MSDKNIKNLAEKFRLAVEQAHSNGCFQGDLSFRRFPVGCCGDTCYLLAEYLRQHGIETVWCSYNRGDWSHAWLVIKDDRIKPPTPTTFVCPEEIRSVLAGYGVEKPEKPVDNTRYEGDDIKEGLIIDITGDQFDDYDDSVYVGYMDSFHSTFEFSQAHDYIDLNNIARLTELYSIILKYL